jgi:hypothetical protein
MPLTELCCDHTLVSDMTPVKEMPLTLVCFTPRKITKGIDAIRGMKSLKTVGISWEGKGQFPSGEFWKKYDAGEFGKPITAFKDPAFQRWVQDVATLPAEKQVEAIGKKLQELNPGFDGKATGANGTGRPWMENGVVIGFGFSTENVTDISPVRALERLRVLSLGGGDNWSRRTGSKLSDLSPLQGMHLTDLECIHTQVSDLSPLEGMPLKELICSATKVSDLSPLKGMPLWRLYCDHTPVSDLSPLEGLNLAEIAFTPKNITKGLDALRQMKSLKTLGPSWDKQFPPAEFWKKYDAGEFGEHANVSH